MSELVIALDFDDALDALQMATQLRGTAKWLKVGLELFITEGPRVVQTLHGMGYHVFLDLKLHDIPNTVAGATKAALTAGADMITLHMGGGERMCREAVAVVQAARAASNRTALLMGVTVLTSFAEGEMPGYHGSLSELAALHAANAAAWGLDGVVCSGHEVERIKALHPKLLALTPGIRLANAAADDQRRVMTPARAVALGSDFLVVGRPITRAEHPAEVAQAVLVDMASAG